MKKRQAGWAASTLALAVLAGCGSGGPGTGPDMIPPGPSYGQGTGARQESPGRGFDNPGYEPESPGPTWGDSDDGPGGPGGPGGGDGGPGGPGGDGGPGGPGGGASREDLIDICKSGCDGAAATCDIDVSECKSECEEIPDPTTHPCGNQIRALAYCTGTGTGEVTCVGGTFTVAGCEDELDDFLKCMSEAEDGDQGPPSLDEMPGGGI